MPVVNSPSSAKPVVFENSEVEVYTLDTTASDGWLTANWHREVRLIPISSTEIVGSTGDASFQLLRDTHMEPQDFIDSDYGADGFAPNIEAGNLVAITTGPAPIVCDPEEILWLGYIDSVALTQLENVAKDGFAEYVGSVKALELGHLFNKTWPDGFNRSNSAATVKMDSATIKTAIIR